MFWTVYMATFGSLSGNHVLRAQLDKNMSDFIP